MAKKEFTNGELLDAVQNAALVFIAEKDTNKIIVLQDGKHVDYIRTIDIHAGYNELTTHTIEYVTTKC